MAQWQEVSPAQWEKSVFRRIGKDWMLVTAEKENGSVNAMTASWGGLGIMWNKPVAFVVIRPQRYTKEFVDASGRLSLTFFGEEYRKMLGYMGTVSGKDADKVAVQGLTVTHEGETPYFEEADTAMITRVLFAQPYEEASFLDSQIYPVQVTFKKMKTVRLRVVAGGQIRLSAPNRTSRAWLEQFLHGQESWIVSNVEKMSQKGRASAEQTPLTAAERKEALAYLMPMVEQWHPVVAVYGVLMPHVTVRRMRSRYGSCSVNRGRITLAAVLLEVPRECAEYVVLHELTHFLHPDHGHEFYRFIEKHMQDWKERERLLKQMKMT